MQSGENLEINPRALKQLDEYQSSVIGGLLVKSEQRDSLAVTRVPTIAFQSAMGRASGESPS